VVNSVRKRVIATSIVFAFIATATAAAMLWSGAPADICLCPGRTAPKALAQASTQQAEALAGIPHTTPIPLAGAGKVSLSPLSAVGASMRALAGDDKPRSTSAAARGWAPWGNSSDHRVSSASFSPRGGGSLGGLWRGMSPFGGHGSSSTHQTEHTTVVHSTHPASTPKPPSSRPAPPSIPTPAPVPAPPATVPPTDPGPPWPLPAPAPSQTPVPLPLPGGGPAGGGIGGGGGISAAATPEPGSLALIATGVVGLFVARRRRNP